MGMIWQKMQKCAKPLYLLGLQEFKKTALFINNRIDLSTKKRISLAIACVGE